MKWSWFKLGNDGLTNGERRKYARAFKSGKGKTPKHDYWTRLDLHQRFPLLYPAPDWEPGSWYWLPALPVFMWEPYISSWEESYTFDHTRLRILAEERLALSVVNPWSAIVISSIV